MKLYYIYKTHRFRAGRSGLGGLGLSLEDLLHTFVNELKFIWFQVELKPSILMRKFCCRPFAILKCYQCYTECFVARYHSNPSQSIM